MLRELVKKILIFFFRILILSIAVFYLARLAPGDPLVSYYGERVEKMSPQERAQAEEKLGLKEPICVQYARWLSGALKGDFGISYKYKRDVLDVLKGRILPSLLLGGIGFVLIFALALLLGMVCAWFEGRWIDKITCKVGTVMSCLPEFWLALVLILLFSVWLKVLPGSGAYTVGKAGDIGDRARHLILPLTLVVISHLWYYAYMIRNMALEEMRADYVLLAKAKGLGRREILLRHCLRNIMPPYLSIMAVSVPHIMGGTAMIETVFSYPGIGTLSYESARFKDYNLLMVLCLFSGALVILCSFAAQAVNERIDPEMRAKNVSEVGKIE